MKKKMAKKNASHSCATCKYCFNKITDEPCMDCDPRFDSPKNHWEGKDGNR